jgi:hypothetical protein
MAASKLELKFFNQCTNKEETKNLGVQNKSVADNVSFFFCPCSEAAKHL